MNKPVIAGIAAGDLLAGFVVLGPLGQLNLGAQAQSTGTTSLTDTAFAPNPADQHWRHRDLN
ncbi:MAG TPA: hypothetical protein VJZ68_09545 [Nitrososphaera sp.]|nr:hypothetical protein [Nitrososphaera sp.]